MPIRKGIVFLNTENDTSSMARLVAAGWTGCGFKHGERFIDYCYASSEAVYSALRNLDLFYALDESDRLNGLTMTELQALVGKKAPPSPTQLDLF